MVLHIINGHGFDYGCRTDRPRFLVTASAPTKIQILPAPPFARQKIAAGAFQNLERAVFPLRGALSLTGVAALIKARALRIRMYIPYCARSGPPFMSRCTPTWWKDTTYLPARAFVGQAGRLL